MARDAAWRRWATTAGAASSRDATRPLPLHRRGLGRPLRDLAARPGQARRGRPGRARRPADRRRRWSKPAAARAERRGKRAPAPTARAAGRRRADRARRAPCAGALEPELRALMARHPDRRRSTRSETELGVVVEPERARFGAWYEMFPRSATAEPGRHGTFRDVEAPSALRRRRWASTCSTCRRSIRSAARTARARTTRSSPSPDDPGSPWAIGAAEGGHTADPPRARHAGRLRRAGRRGRASTASRSRSTSPSSARPTIRRSREHPEWFRQRPDGTIQYAENPPKKYQDIYPFDFETEDWRELWEELQERRSASGSSQGVRIFRVDNPHTKPFAFWEWLHRRGQARPSGRDLPGRGVHAAEGDVPAGQARLHAVVHLLHLAQHASRS